MTTPPLPQPGAAETTKLAHFPAAFFAAVMGLAGLTLAWLKAEEVYGLDTIAPHALALLTAAVFLALLSAYVLKAVFAPDAVRAEYDHPVKLHFLPTISISLVLISHIATGEAPALAEPLFAAGAALHLTLTFLVLHNWFNKTHFETVHLNPAWFIPIVGNVLVPLPGARLGYIELSWFYFSIGIVFWIVLFAIIVNRVLFHHPLPQRLAPTIFILVAPPAAGFLSYVALTGEIDVAARILFYFALFMTLFLATQVPRLMRIEFALSWWAYSFPLAAVTAASLTMAERVGGEGFDLLAILLLTVTTLVVTALFARTVLAVVRDEILRPD